MFCPNNLNIRHFECSCPFQVKLLQMTKYLPHEGWQTFGVSTVKVFTNTYLLSNKMNCTHPFACVMQLWAIDNQSLWWLSHLVTSNDCKVTVICPRVSHKFLASTPPPPHLLKVNILSIPCTVHVHVVYTTTCTCTCTVTHPLLINSSLTMVNHL